MYIWHLIPSTNPGGNEVFAKTLIENFPIKAHHRVFSASNIDGFIADDLSIIADLQKLNTEKSFNNIAFFFKLFYKQKPDAIIIHTFNISLLVFILIAKIFNIRKVIIKVGNPPRRKYLLKIRFFIYCLRLLNIPLVFCSKYALDEFKKFFKLPEKSLTITNGCDLIKTTSLKKRYFSSLKKYRKLSITMIARLDSIKDQETLIKAFLRTKNEKWELNLIGDGERRTYLQNLVNNLNGKQKIRFWGSRNNVIEILSNTEIFAFSTTKNEGFGIALIEALSMGLPIIASDVPACREVLLEGKAGVLVGSGDIKAWEEKLSDLMQSEIKRIELGKKSQEISNLYDIKIIARDYWDFLKTI